MNRILVVNVNWMGDAIFSMPVFRALKESYPQSHVSVLAVPRIKDIMEMNPFVDEILIYDEKGRHKTPWGKLELIREIRRRKFDAAFLLHRSLTRALLVFLAGIPRRIGYDEKGRGFLLTHKVPKEKGRIHRTDHYLKVVEAFGVKVNDRTYESKVSSEVEVKIRRLLEEKNITPHDFTVAVHCGGNWDLKRWPLEKFALLIDRLTKETHAKVIIPGGKDDVVLAEKLASLSKSHPLILAGRTDLKELAALFQRVDLLISSDSGPLHLASSVGTPVIGLFGPTRPEVTGPRGNNLKYILQKDVGCNREPCYNLQCPDNVCMQTIEVEDVMRVVKEVRNKK